MEDELPTQRELRYPMLLALKEFGGSANNDQVADFVASHLNLSTAQLAIPSPGEDDKRTKFEYYLAWTRTALKGTGAIQKVGNSIWSLTEIGLGLKEADFDNSPPKQAKLKEGNKSRETIWGHIPGIRIGEEYESREAVRLAGLQRHRIKGISGTKDRPADAIVLSEGYPTDEDHWDFIVYTGEGGHIDGVHHKDQELTGGNMGLVLAFEMELPIRVIRGFKGNPKHSPNIGFRYDGLYRVNDYYRVKNEESGYFLWMFSLQREESINSLAQVSSLEASDPKRPEGVSGPAPRRNVYSTRTIRNSEVTDYVKKLYDYKCQICLTRVKTRNGYYAEGAHIHPLGKPHKGPDTVENVLCLCPNCHVELDKYWLFIDPSDLGVYETKTRLKIADLSLDPRHEISIEGIEYHKKLADLDGT